MYAMPAQGQVPGSAPMMILQVPQPTGMAADGAQVGMMPMYAMPAQQQQQLNTPQIPVIMTTNTEGQPVLVQLSQTFPGPQPTQQQVTQQQPLEAKFESDTNAANLKSPRKKGGLSSFLPSMKSQRKSANPSKIVPVDADPTDQNNPQTPPQVIPEDAHQNNPHKLSPQELNPEDAATRIQAVIRGHLERKAFGEQKTAAKQIQAATQIQAVARGYIHRQATKGLREQQTAGKQDNNYDNFGAAGGKSIFSMGIFGGKPIPAEQQANTNEASSKLKLPSFCEDSETSLPDAAAQPKDKESQSNNMEESSGRETPQHYPISSLQNEQQKDSPPQTLQEDDDESNEEGEVSKYVIKPIKFVFIIIGIVLAGYIADFCTMLANVFLIVKGVNHLVHWDYDLHIQLLVLEFGRFLRIIHPALEVLAQVYHALIDFFKNLDIEFIPLETMQVTCDGAKAPGKLFGNILILLFVTVLFEARIFSFLALTLKASLNLLKYSLKMKGYSVIIILLITNSFLFFEFIFRYIVQLLATGTVVRDFYPSHPHNVNCGRTDEILAVVSSMVAWGVIIPAFHNMMRTFVAGIPSKCNFRHVENKIPLFLRKIFLHPSIWREKSEVKKNISALNLRLLRRHEENDEGVYIYHEVPSLFEIVLLIFLDFCRCRFKVLRNYIKCMRWKVDQLFKMTFGLWDKEILRGFKIGDMIDTYSVNKDDVRKEHQEAIASIGINHAMIWQFVPAFVVAAKFGEYSNKCPLYVHKSGKVKPLLCQDDLKPWSGDSMKSKIVTTFKWIFSCVKGRLVKWIIYMMMFIFTCAFALTPSVFWLWGYALVVTPFRLERIIVTIRDFFF
mmetsp:Transcript_9513/g.12470  ORF Transcript_9513/g.12470 Transcript_9513/m.12470 type:complete len:841 (-) Transcript_9513:177-2699(-)